MPNSRPFADPDKARAAGQVRSPAKAAAAARNGTVKTARKAQTSRANGFQSQAKPPTSVLSLRVLKSDHEDYKGLDEASKEEITRAMQKAFAQALIQRRLL